MTEDDKMRQRSPLTSVAPLVVFVALVLAIWLIDALRAQQASIQPAPAAPAVPAAGAPPTETYNFDFWILALSWSPDYCATDGQSDVQQCAAGRQLGFVLHGLWPQYNRGYPSYCSGEKMPASVAARFPNLYPNDALYSYQWEKHGTCSGLNPEQYLGASARIKAMVAIPDAYRRMPQPVRTTPTDIKRNFMAANPGMRDLSLAVFCSGSGRYLTEVWVCVGLDEALTSCSSEIRSRERTSCQGSGVTMRNMR